MIQTSLYYLSFFVLFVMKYDVSKIARVVILMGLWFIASPLNIGYSITSGLMMNIITQMN